jgi:hypothetical protein
MGGQRKALIVANDEYEQEALRDLLAPAADAEALRQVLSDPRIGDFAVQVVRNEPSYVIQGQIEDLFADSRPDDLLLLHFSGHGLKSESGELFFAASNTRPNRLGSTAVSAAFVQRCMRDSRSRSIVLLLDCCYGGAFAQGVTVRAAGNVNVLDSFPQDRPGGRGRAVITASSAMEFAFEGNQIADDHQRRPSVFTAALVEGLATGDADRDEDGWVSLDELYDYVFDKVREQNPHQTPSRQIELQGELYLARSGRQRIRIPAADTPADPAGAGPDTGGGEARPAPVPRRSRLIALAGITILAVAGGITAALLVHSGPPAKPVATSGTSAKPVATLVDPTGSAVNAVAFRPIGDTLAVGDNDGSTYLWDVATKHHGAPLNSIIVNAVAFSPDGRTLAAGNLNGTTYLWDVATGSRIAILTDPGTGSHDVDAVAFSPNGEILAAGDSNDSTYLWDVATRQRIGTLPDSGGSDVNAVAFSPNGEILAAGDSSIGTFLWDVATRQPITTLPDSGSNSVGAVAFSPNGDVLAAGDSEGYVSLWDVATRHLITPLTNVGGAANGVAFSPDSHTLAVGDDGGHTYLWKVG